MSDTETSRPVKIAPSILSADFAMLGEGVQAIHQGGADWIHVDVMDGQFVPNLTFGPPVIRAVRGYSDRPFDVHLMVERPEQMLSDYVEAGANLVTVHVEACRHLQRTLVMIRELGARAGVVLNPATSLSSIEEVIPDLDLLLLMTVNPGFGGQQFIPQSLDKIRRCREMLDQAGSHAELCVDGGISAKTAGAVVAAGATVLVAGSAIYGHPEGPAAGIAALRAAARSA